VPEEATVAALRRLPFGSRIVTAFLLAVVGALFAMLGLALLAVQHWMAAVVVLVIAEPIALFLLLGAFYCLVPLKSIGRFLGFVFGRAKLAIWIVLSAAALATVVGLAWVAAIWLSGMM
jgi:hypothetical protein